MCGQCTFLSLGGIRVINRAPMPPSPITDLARVIQLSIAPVFLITGIASLLGVLSGRLARLIDRARVLEALAAAARFAKS